MLFLKEWYPVFRNQTIFILAFVFPITTHAQNLLPIGARINSLGNTSVTIADVFSVFSNPATLSKMEGTSVGVYVDHRYNIQGLNSLAFAFSKTIKKSGLAIGATRYGDEQLNHYRSEIAFGHTVRNVSLGLGLGYHQLTVLENGVARNVLIQFGGVAEITPKLKYGGHVFNLFNSKLGKGKIYYPVIMRTGITYQPIRMVHLSIEIEKDSRFDPNLKLGLEYKLREFLALRTGINSLAATGFGGIGLTWEEISFNYGVSHHNKLGLVHFLDLTYLLFKKEEKPELKP